MKVCDYWEEAVADALDEHGVKATSEQIVAIAADIQACHDSYGLAFYTPSENPERAEIKRLETALSDEREKVTCRVCNGTGVEVRQGPYHSAANQCDRCRGTGRHAP